MEELKRTLDAYGNFRYPVQVTSAANYVSRTCVTAEELESYGAKNVRIVPRTLKVGPNPRSLEDIARIYGK